MRIFQIRNYGLGGIPWDIAKPGKVKSRLEKVYCGVVETPVLTRWARQGFSTKDCDSEVRHGSCIRKVGKHQ